jgi:catechol 2,3-dioxygenase-like lactoylglutathione lyase family enzyme
MTIQRMEHVGIVVDDLAAATEFFAELGLEQQGEGSVEGRWVDRVVGLDGVRAEPGPASVATRAPVWTAIPASLPAATSHSPVWSPPRTRAQALTRKAVLQVAPDVPRDSGGRYPPSLFFASRRPRS